jgi:hypothetical protein
MVGGDLDDLSNMSGDAPQGPVLPSRGRTGTGGALTFAGGLLATLALVVALVALWPSGDDEPVRSDDVAATTVVPGAPATTVPGATGEPSQSSSTTAAAPVELDLFGGDLPVAVADLVAASGSPTQLLQVSVYPDYAFLTYRDPARPENIDRRIWRDGAAGEASANPIDDRVDAETEPALFALTEVDLGILPGLVADAVTRYDREVAVSHVIIDRFLPFDERVLIRVYASPTDGRSGGGYVSYDTAGTLVRVCC